MNQRMASDDLMTEISQLAAERQHVLTADMTGSRRLTLASALSVRSHLQGRPARHPAQEPAPAPVRSAPADGSLPPVTAFRHVPPGRYAVESRTGNNDLDFFEVRRPEEGKWAGYTFVERIIGGHDNAPVRGIAARRALQAIVRAGFDESRLRAAQELGLCKECGRHLTDEESRLAGMGPYCRNK